MSKYKWLKKRKLGNSAVSEVFGTIMLITISVTLFSAIYASVLSVDVEEAPPSVNLVGLIDDNILVVAHQGGESLLLKTLIILGANTGASINFEVQDYLSTDNTDDGYWDIGEKMEYDLDDFTDFNRFDPLDLTIVDPKSQSVIMMGTLQEEKFTDISVYFSDEITTTPYYDNPFDVVIITDNLGPGDTEDVIVEVKLPEVGFYFESASGDGTYDESTGLWDIGSLDADTEATLTLSLVPIYTDKPVVTQLAFIIDGSSAISVEEWTMITSVISEAITSGAPDGIPNDGYVQLTIVTYGIIDDAIEPFTDTVIEPTFITSDNYQELADTVASMTQPGGTSRPMAHGFRRTADLLYGLSAGVYDPSSFHHHARYRQVINLIAGANPNVPYPVPTLTSFTPDVQNAWSAAVKERNRMITMLGMTHDQDEIDVEAMMGATDDLDINWLETRIAYPAPITVCSLADPPEDIGWVMEVGAEADFIKAIDSLFSIAFYSRIITAEVISTKYFDPDTTNDFASITIIPQ